MDVHACFPGHFQIMICEGSSLRLANSSLIGWRCGKRFHIRLGITVIVALWQLSDGELGCLLGQCKMLQVHQQQNENQFLGVWISMWDHIHYWLNQMVLFGLTELVQV
jgi:hypothetical protein